MNSLPNFEFQISGRFGSIQKRSYCCLELVEQGGVDFACSVRSKKDVKDDVL